MRKKTVNVVVVSLVMVALVLAAFGAILPRFSKLPVEHIVIIFQENRTFDHYFGTFPGANGIPEGAALPVAPGSSQRITPFHLTTTSWTGNPVTDLSHAHKVAEVAYDGGKMDGFVYAEDSNLTMGYYDNRDIPQYWELASKFVLMDNFFSSEMGPSLPNHLYLIAGQSGGLLENANVSRLNLDFPTIMDEMDAKGVSWRYYFDAIDYMKPDLWDPLPAFVQFRRNPERLSTHMAPSTRFIDDVKAGNLPQVVWVMPPGGGSEHPPADIKKGEAYVMSLVDAIQQSPYGDSTVIFITWDDYGGFYDHVPPPQIDSFGLGFRVPCIVVSALAKRGLVDHTQADFCSILKFIETIHSLPPLTNRDAVNSDMAQTLSPPQASLIVFGMSISTNVLFVLAILLIGAAVIIKWQIATSASK